MRADDMRARMFRTVAGSSAPVEPAVAEQVPPDQATTTPLSAPARLNPHPRRVTLDLTEEDHRALRIASLDLHIPMAELLRQLVRQWRRGEVRIGHD